MSGDQSAQFAHRKNLLQKWSIPTNSKIVELGCGQGICTEILAAAVGSGGHIDAIDPAPLDYGSPETLGEAQARISSYDIGPQISWHQAEPLDFLASTKQGTYDGAVLCHSIWYFASPAQVSDTLKALKGTSSKLYVAEYSPSTTEPGALPHVLATLARASLEAHKAVSDQNIRTALPPSSIRSLAEEAGWKLVQEEIITPDADLEDGSWETRPVIQDSFLKEIDENIKDEKVKAALVLMREAVKSAAERMGGKSFRTMDVWVATFE
jgi:hypothetical protein